MLVLFAFFVSAWVGISLGARCVHILSGRFIKPSEDIKKRMSASGSAFGFLFLPVLVGLYTNANLGTNIELYSLGVHFLWACIGACIVFYLRP